METQLGDGETGSEQVSICCLVIYLSLLLLPFPYPGLSFAAHCNAPQAMALPHLKYGSADRLLQT